jgi:hypothetical protein
MALPGGTVSAVLAGSATRVTCLRYADRVFLSLAQREAFGALLAATTTVHPDGHHEPSVRVLLGDRDDDLALLVATRVQQAVLCVPPGGRRRGGGGRRATCAAAHVLLRASRRWSSGPLRGRALAASPLRPTGRSPSHCGSIRPDGPAWDECVVQTSHPSHNFPLLAAAHRALDPLRRAPARLTSPLAHTRARHRARLLAAATAACRCCWGSA